MIRDRVLHVFMLCCVVLMLGCGKTTPKGAIGHFDLRSHLPADVVARAPADAGAQEYTKQVNVGDPAAKVLIRWRAFKDGQNAYILSTSFEVLEAANGVELKPSVVGSPLNHGSRDAVVEMIAVQINWDGSKMWKTHLGTVTGTIYATGEWSD
ncbi:MAG TPA: hypothetical protein VF588_21680 [Pyrinomonadaceae bacterium]